MVESASTLKILNQQQENFEMKNLTFLIALGIFALVLIGCGGNSTFATTNQFAGRFGGDVLFDITRGGGPSLQLSPLTVSNAGQLGGSATFQDQNGSRTGQITGTLTNEGALQMTVAMPGTQFRISGTDLGWVVEAAGRGGPSQYVKGTVTVQQRDDTHPYGQDSSGNGTIEFWTE